MIFGSVCSGIEAASVALVPLGWTPAFYSEYNPFCQDLLAERWPGTDLYLDFTTIHDYKKEIPPLDILIGGTPCQSFSVAGRRAGVDDPRGVLAFEFLRLCGTLKPRWFVFENVPGLLSSKRGEDFSDWLRAAVQCGYYCAWRVLDCQYWGLAQRRKRVFVVGYLGDWRPPAAVLFESQSVPGNIEEGGEEGEEVAGPLGGGSGARGWRDDTDRMTFIPILEATKRQGTSNSSRDGLGIGNPGDPMFSLQSSGQHAVAFNWQSGGSKARLGYGNLPNLQANQVPAVALNLRGRDGGSQPELSSKASLRSASGGSSRSYVASSGVRRLTPLECERLQGFPDNYTLIDYNGKPASDGPRYKAIGNSFPVPVVRWLGQRIEAVDQIVGRRGGRRK